MGRWHKEFVERHGSTLDNTYGIPLTAPATVPNTPSPPTGTPWDMYAAQGLMMVTRPKATTLAGKTVSLCQSNGCMAFAVAETFAVNRKSGIAEPSYCFCKDHLLRGVVQCMDPRVDMDLSITRI